MMRLPQRNARSSQSRFFAYVQSTGWYQELFLSVAATLADLSPGSRVMDVGTGPAGLLALLQQRLSLDCVGVDADQSMLNEARRNPHLTATTLAHVPSGQPLPFLPHTFDGICFCSVLYLLDKESLFALLHQAESLLRPQGRLVILTPTGSRRSPAAPAPRHWTLALWRRLTSAAGREWQTQHLALDFAKQHGMTYDRHLVFGGMATVEVLHTP